MGVATAQSAAPATGGPGIPPPVQQEKEVPIPEGADAKIDKPVIELIPIENIRIDPSANWVDPIGSSPYVIHMIPMYVMDIKEKMDSGEWILCADSIILTAGEIKLDSTRSARQVNRDDQYSADTKEVTDYQISWVQRHIHRRGGIDWEFYTLGDQHMLTSPKPLKKSVFHGKRPCHGLLHA
jgi:hypothetical protein